MTLSARMLFQTYFRQELKTPVSTACGQASYGRGTLPTRNCVRRTLGGTPLRWVFSMPRKKCPMVNLLLVACLAAFCLQSAALAETTVANSPIRVVLPDGVRLILKPEAETERTAVSLFIAIRPDISPNSATVGEMVARTLFYGNANRTQNSIQALAGEVGGSLDVLRSGELVAVNYVTSPEQLPEALHLLCDCLKYASFAPESLNRALLSLRKERQNEHATGFERGYAAVKKLLGQEEPPEDLLRRVTQAQARAYFLRNFAPTQTVISIVGRFDPVRTQGLLNAFLADYTRPNFLAPSIVDMSLPLPAQTSPLLLPSSGLSAYAFVGVPAPSAASPDYPAFMVLQALLGGGHASRLFRQAREMLGFGYEVGAIYQAERAPVLITYLQWNPHRSATPDAKIIPPDMAGKLLGGELDAISKDAMNAEELNRARNVAIGQDALRHERARDRAFLFGWYEALGLGYAYDVELPRRLAKVTREDILRTAKMYLDQRAIVTVLPSTP